MEHLIKPDHTSNVVMNVTPESAGWQYLSFKVASLKAGETYRQETGGNEVALVPLSGTADLSVDNQTFPVSRKGYFQEPPHILYAPPGKTVAVQATADFEFAIGGAPAEGRYPVRLFRPEEMKQEVRGGGAATRQVNHVLAHPLPAERLILFEVYVPGGMYSGWPPHCHDGYAGSPYLEEVYYYRIQPETGYCIHRNYRRDNDFDELFTVRDGDLVLVTQGFHPVAVPPGSQVYFLNYLAGELQDEARGTPPYDDPDWGWMKVDYEGNKLDLPVF
ncbi:MAG: 5-deoxy-glucuronate isomerase [Anaerolineae bacterium]